MKTDRENVEVNCVMGLAPDSDLGFKGAFLVTKGDGRMHRNKRECDEFKKQKKFTMTCGVVGGVRRGRECVRMCVSVRVFLRVWVRAHMHTKGSWETRGCRHKHGHLRSPYNLSLCVLIR